jgi:hypothetical protein
MIPRIGGYGGVHVVGGIQSRDGRLIFAWSFCLDDRRRDINQRAISCREVFMFCGDCQT